ncbi:MAG: hypothetical protein Q9206_002821 [Seirophora lacunosa]
MYITTLLSFFLVLGRWTLPVTAAAATIIRASNPNPSCWDDVTQFQPVVFRECIEIINNDIYEDFDPDIPLKFSTDPTLDPDIRLPKFWKRVGANCGVGIDFKPTKRGYDRTTLRDVKAAAQAVAIECVIRPPHVGGFVQLGWYDNLGVLISGGYSLSALRNSTLSS